MQVTNLHDLLSFIGSVSKDYDPCIIRRNEIKIQTNLYSDGNSSKRVYDFVAKKVKEMFSLNI